MTVFIGDTGRVMLTRLGTDKQFITEINDSDVREGVNRFSIDYAHEQIITGDRLEVTTTGGEDLTWIDDPSADDSFTRYVHVDEAGGMRFYNTFSQAIRGNPSDAIGLLTPAQPQEIRAQVVNGDDERCLAQVTGYQITTSRETIDTTHLGAQYRKQYEAGLIQGQGQIECLWHRSGDCEVETDASSGVEFSSYLARLCIRLVNGAAFWGQFYIFADESREQRSVWYDAQRCIVTNVAVSVSPSQAVQTTINFVTNGAIALREGYLPSYLELEESDFDVKLEQTPGGNIELENND